MSAEVLDGFAEPARRAPALRRAARLVPLAAGLLTILLGIVTHRALLPTLVEGAAVAAVVRFGVQSPVAAAALGRVLSLSLSSALDVAVRVVLGAVMLWTVGTIVLWPDIETARYSPSATSSYSPTLVLLLALAGALAALPAWRVSARVAAWLSTLRTRRRKLTVIGVALPILALQFWVAFSTARIPAFDAGAVLASEQQHAVTGKIPSFIDWYYSILPNNLLLGLLYNRLFSVLAAFGITSVGLDVMAAVMLNALALSLAAVLVLRIARRLGGSRLAVFIAPGVVLFIVFSPWLNTPYSDTLGLLVVAVCLSLLLLRADLSVVHPHGGLILAALIGVSSAAAFALKPTTVLVVGAWMVVDLLRQPPSIRDRRLGALTGIAIVAVAFVVARSAILLGLNSSGLTTFDIFQNRNALPFSHLMVMGSHGLGGYDGDDVTRSLAQKDPAARSLMDFGLYGQNVAALGPAGYARFLALKALWMLGDGSFFQGREGDAIAAPYLVRTSAATDVQSFFQYSGSASHVLMASVWQASWLLVLLAIGLGSLVRLQSEARRVSTVLRLALLLLLAFLLLSEGRSRYFYLDVPVFLLLAGISVGALESRVRGLQCGSARRLGRVPAAAAMAAPQGRPRVGVRLFSRRGTGAAATTGRGG